MSTLEDKLLGEKKENYCSSSEESETEEPSGQYYYEDSSDCDIDRKKARYSDDKCAENGSKNTGPKGVMNDYQEFKSLKRARLEESKLEIHEMLKKLSTTNSSEPGIDSDNFLDDYRKKRLLQMQNQVSSSKEFGDYIELFNREEFEQAIEMEDKRVTIIVHVTDKANKYCSKIDEIFTSLCKEYRDVKFRKVDIASAEFSLQFKMSGLPSLLIYKNKEVVTSFVRITDLIGNEFYESDLENFLIEHGHLPDKSN